MKRLIISLLLGVMVLTSVAQDKKDALRDYILSNTSCNTSKPIIYQIYLSFDDWYPTRCKLTAEQFKMLGIPLQYDEEAYQEYNVVGRLHLADEFNSLLVRYRTEHEMFVDLVNLDQDWNFIAAHRMSYDETLENVRRTYSTIEMGYIRTAQIQYEKASWRLGYYQIENNGKFTECPSKQWDYDLMDGYKLHESQRELSGEQYAYLLALSNDNETEIFEEGVCEGTKAHCFGTQYAEIDTPNFFGLVAPQRHPDIRKISLYDKRDRLSWKNIFNGYSYLLADFRDGILLFYDENSATNPDNCITILDLNRSKSQLIHHSKLLAGKDILAPNWFASVSVSMVTDDAIELGSGTSKVVIARDKMEDWRPNPVRPIFIEDGGPKVSLKYLVGEKSRKFDRFKKSFKD